jgi:hypothetical protein
MRAISGEDAVLSTLARTIASDVIGSLVEWNDSFSDFPNDMLISKSCYSAINNL